MPFLILLLAIALPIMKLLGLWAALAWGWALLPGMVILVAIVVFFVFALLFIRN